jgi:hypothetical protein
LYIQFSIPPSFKNFKIANVEWTIFFSNFLKQFECMNFLADVQERLKLKLLTFNLRDKCNYASSRKVAGLLSLAMVEMMRLKMQRRRKCD